MEVMLILRLCQVASLGDHYGFCQRCQPSLSPGHAFSWSYVYDACSGPFAEEWERCRGQWFLFFSSFRDDVLFPVTPTDVASNTALNLPQSNDDESEDNNNNDICINKGTCPLHQRPPPTTFH